LVELLARETFLAGFNVRFTTRPITDEPADIRNQSIEMHQSVGHFFYMANCLIVQSSFNQNVWLLKEPFIKFCD